MEMMTCNEFKKQFEAVFGKCEFNAESGEVMKQSPNWIDDKDLKEMPDSIVFHKRGKK